MNKLIKWKAFIDTYGIKSADLKDKLLSRVLRLSELPKCKERSQIAICCLQWLGKLKCLKTGFDASLSFLRREGVLGIGQSSSCFADVYLSAIRASYAIETLAEVHVKWSVILMDRLGPDILLALWMKGQVLHRARAHLKVPGWSLVWNELLTKKLPMFCHVWMKRVEVAKR